MIVHIGLGICLLASLVFGLLACYAPWLPLLVGVLCIMNLGIGLFTPILNRLTLEQSDEPMGIKVGIFSMLRVGSGVVGSMLIPILTIDTVLPLSWVILIFTILAILLSRKINWSDGT